jgi:D-alanyl-D-alanine-carboxypeptidase/D-alanyl-D-alanine-endopeptidase
MRQMRIRGSRAIYAASEASGIRARRWYTAIVGLAILCGGGSNVLGRTRPPAAQVPAAQQAPPPKPNAKAAQPPPAKPDASKSSAVPLETLRPEIEKLVRPLLESQRAVGLGIGVFRDGRTATFGFGRLSRQSTKSPDERTVFEIGSITKTFTATLLADMVVRKQMSLEDPVRKWLPEGIQAPTRDGKEILLWHLATHTSGLPRLSKRLTMQVIQHADNPYSRFSVDEMYADLQSASLACVPGEKYAYSNFATGLLGQLLARHAGVGYEELVRSRICKPLGMNDTSIALSADQRARLAPGHDADMAASANWDIPTLAGAGALRSTVHDMLLYVAAHLGRRDWPLAEAARLAHQPRHKIDKSPQSIALGWHCNTHLQILWHNGQTGGYHSYAALQKPKQIAVVVLSNCADGTIDRLGDQILGLLGGAKPEPLKLKATKKVDAKTLQRYVGNYEMPLGATFSVTREDDRLSVQLTGQPRFRVYPESENEFAYRVVEARITFVPDKNGVVGRLILHQHGLDLPAFKHGLLFYAGRKAIDFLRTPAKESPKTPAAPPAPKASEKPPPPPAAK